MARARRILLSLLAMIGLASALAWTSGALACPAKPVATHLVSHDVGCRHSAKPQRQNTPAIADGAACTACVAVLAQPVVVGAHPPILFAPFAERLDKLSGIAPAVDPPPPRGA
jgi:hypothetical protein